MIHPEFNNGFTNHVPMVVSALTQLNATAEHISSYLKMNQAKLQAVTEPSTVIESDVQLAAWLGKHQNYGGIVDYLTEQQAGSQQADFLARYLPVLANGISGGAFHPVIRLGHAVADNNNEEVILALAYWVWAYQPLNWPAQGKPFSGTLIHVIKHLRDGVDWPTEELNYRTITEEFAAVTNIESYQVLAIVPSANQVSLEVLEQLAASALWMHDDFTLLHGVTGLHAIRTLQAVVSIDVLLLPMWRAFVVAWLANDLHWQETSSKEWVLQYSADQLIKIASKGTRDHTVKLVAACVSEYSRTGDVIYLQLAEREIINDETLMTET